MTVTNETSRFEYVGNGSTTEFSFPSRFLADADLVVLLVVTATGASTTQVLTTNYTVAGAGDDAGGTVTMLVAPLSTETLVIYRDPAVTQVVDFTENDNQRAESVENAVDKNTMIAQRLATLLDGRTIVLDDATLAGSFDPTLPAPVASKLIGISSDGLSLVLEDQAVGGVIPDGTVTLAKLADLATKTAIGRNTAGTGVPEAVTIAQMLDWLGTAAQGDVFFRGAAATERLAAGTNGQVLTSAGAAADPTWETPTSAATAEEQEAATEAAKYVAPATQHRHPASSKAWVKFTGTGTVAIDRDYGVSSITDNGTGDYTINFDTDFSDADYCVVFGGANTSTANADEKTSEEIGTRAVGSITVLTRTGTSSYGLVDAASVCAAFFGDQ